MAGPPPLSILSDDHTVQITEELIKSQSGQFDLESIQTLNLASLGIRRISLLHLCPELTVLDLSGNRLLVVEGLKGLDHLRSLNLSHNHISVLSGLTVPSLERIRLEDNRLADMEALEPLFALKRLKEVSLTANPVCKLDGYRDSVLNRAPESLMLLDGICVPLAKLFPFPRSEKGEQAEAEAVVATRGGVGGQGKGWERGLTDADSWIGADVLIEEMEKLDVKQAKDALADVRQLEANARALTEHYVVS